MELAQERLISEVLGLRRPINYRAWPRRRAAQAPSELAVLKSHLRRIWNSGDYDRLACHMAHGAEAFYRRLAVPAGARLLDVACGSGQLALIAAREGANVTGVDFAETQVERAIERARVEGLGARFQLGDAESLPFDGASFDVVTSLIGAMFAPRPNVVRSELLRVCRPGGIIAMANWTPHGFVGRMYRVLANYVPMGGEPSPFQWGDETVVRERFNAGVSGVQLFRRSTELTFPFPPGEVVRFFRSCHGPTNRAFASLSRSGRKGLQDELESLWSDHNQARGGMTRVDAEWLEVVAIRG